jgi:hypothetical protein
MVTPTAESAASPMDRNWNRVPKRNRQKNSSRDFGDLAFAILLSPHLALPGEEVPDLLDRPMRYGVGCLRGSEVSHNTFRQAEQNANIGPIWRAADALDWQPHGLKRLHNCLPLQELESVSR